MASVGLTGDLKFPETMNKEDISDESASKNWENNMQKVFSTKNPEIFIENTVKFMDSIYAIASSKAYLEQISVLRKYFKTIMNLLTDDSMDIFICYVTKWIIEKIIDGDCSTWCVKRELLKFVNAILLSNRKKVYFIYKIVKDMPPNYLCKILDSLCYYGDFDLQATILETIFAIYGRTRIIASLKELIPDSTERKYWRNIDQIKENTFDEDCRTFLNKINKKQKNIFSLQCKNIQINGSVYVISMDDENGIWVDFNLLENALSWYQNTDSDESWELITLFASEVDTAFLGTSKENFFEITLKLVGHCVTSVVENQDTVNKMKSVDIIVERSEECDALISKVLPKILHKKFEQSLRTRTNGRTFKSMYQPLSVKVEKCVKYRDSKDTSNVSLTKGVNPISFGSMSNVSSSFNCSKRLGDFEDEDLDISSTDDPNKEHFSEVSEETLNSRNTHILAGRCTNKTFNYRDIIRSQDDSFQEVHGTRSASLGMLQSSTVLCEKDGKKKTNRVFTMRNFDVTDTTGNENIPQSNTDQSKKNGNTVDALIVSGAPASSENQHKHKSRTFTLSDNVFYSCSQLEFAKNEEEINEHLSLNSGATKKKSQQVGKTAKNRIEKAENVVQSSLNFEEQVICTLDAITETSQNSQSQYFSLSPTGDFNVKNPMILSPRLSENDVKVVKPKLLVKEVAESDTINKLVEDKRSSNKMNKNESDVLIDNEQETNKKVLQAEVSKKPHQREPLKQINTAKKGNRDDEVNSLNDPKMPRLLVVAAPKKHERENNRSPKINKSANRNKKINSRKLNRKDVKDFSKDELIVISDDGSEADDFKIVNKKIEASNLSDKTKKIRGKKGNENDVSQTCKSKSVQPDQVLSQIVEKDGVETIEEGYVEKTDGTKSKKIKTKSTSSESVLDAEREKIFEADIRKLAICVNEAENQVNIAGNVALEKDTTPNINDVNDSQVIQEELDGSHIKLIENLDDEDVIATTTKTKTPTSNSLLEEIENEQNRKTVNVEEEFDAFNKIPDVVQSIAENTERSSVTKSGKNRLSNIIRSTKSKKTVISGKLSKRNAKNKKADLVKTQLRSITGKKGKENGKKISETVQMSKKSSFKKKSVQPDYDAIEIVEEKKHDEVDNIEGETEDGIAVIKSKKIESNSIVSAPKRETILETEMNEMVIFLNKDGDENKNMAKNVIPKKDTTPKTNSIDGSKIIQEETNLKQSLDNDDVMMNIVITTKTKTPSSLLKYSSSSQESLIFENKQNSTPIDFDKVFDALKNTPEAIHNNSEDTKRSSENSQSQTEKLNESLKTIDLNELTRSQQIRMLVTYNRTQEDDVTIQEGNKSLMKSVDLFSETKPEVRTRPKRKSNKRYDEEITTAFEEISSVDVIDKVIKITEEKSTETIPEVKIRSRRKSNKENEEEISIDSEEMSKAIPSDDNVIDYVNENTEEKSSGTTPQFRARPKRKSNKRYEDKIEEITTAFEDIPGAISSVNNVVDQLNEITEEKSTPEVIIRPRRKSKKQYVEEITTAFEEIPKAISSVNVIDKVIKITEEKSSETIPEAKIRPRRKSNKQYKEEIEKLSIGSEEPSVDNVIDQVNGNTEEKSSVISPEIRTRPKRKSKKQYEEKIEEKTTAFEDIPGAISSVNNVVDQLNEITEEKSTPEVIIRPRRKSKKQYVEEITTASEEIPQAIPPVENVVDQNNEITGKKSSEKTPEIRTRPKRKSNKRYEDKIEEITTAFEDIPGAISSVNNVVDQLNEITEEKSTPEVIIRPRRRSKKQYVEEITTASEEIPKAKPPVENVVDQNNEITGKKSSETIPEIRTASKRKVNKQYEEEITTASGGIPQAKPSVENVVDQNIEITGNKSNEKTPETRTARPKRKYNKLYEEDIEEITTVFEEIPKAISSVDNIDQVNDTKLNSNNLTKTSTVGRKRRKLYDNTMVMLPSPEEKNEERVFRGIEKISDQSIKQSTILADISTNNGTFNHGYTKQISDKNMKTPTEIKRNVEKELLTSFKKVDKKKPRRSKYEVTYSEEEAKEEAFRKKCRNIVRANTTGIDEFYRKPSKRSKYSDPLEKSKFSRRPITSRNYDINFSLDRSEWAELQYILESERRHSDGRKSSAKEYLKKNKSTTRKSLSKSGPKKEVQENYPVTKKKINILSNICLKPRNNQNIPQDTDKYEEIVENNGDSAQSIDYNFQRDEENVPKSILAKGVSWTALAFFDDEYITINSEDFIGKYLVLFFYPFDFGELPNVFPPTEIQFFNEHFEQFQQLNTNILGCSVDSIYTHKAYVNELHSKSLDRIKYPLIGDSNHKICKAFGVLNHNFGHSYRAVIIIDQKGEVTVKTVVEVNLEMVLADVLEYIKLHRVSL